MITNLANDLDAYRDQARLDGALTLQVALPRSTAHCQFVGIDTLACALTRIELVAAGQTSPDPRTGTGADDIRARATRLASQLNYLLEPICLQECDAPSATAQLRSDPPGRADQAVHYYELTLSASRIQLTRYEKQSGQTRVAVPMQLTREVLQRVLQDLDNAW